KARFDKLGLTWTLPKRDGIRNFSIVGRQGPDVYVQEKTHTQAAVARLDGEGPLVEIDLSIETAEAGATAKSYVNAPQNFEKIIKENFDGVPVPNLDEEHKLGNWHGAMKALSGKDHSGSPLYIRTIYSVLRNVLYLVT